jgi:hypothetical protein
VTVKVTVLIPASPSVTLMSSIESSGDPGGAVVVVVDGIVTVVVVEGGVVVVVGGAVVVVLGRIVVLVVVEVVDVVGNGRPQRGGAGSALALHVLRWAFFVATHTERHALPGLRSGQRALHAFACSAIRRRHSRGQRAAIAAAFTSRRTANASATCMRPL